NRVLEVLGQSVAFYAWQCPYLYDQVYSNRSHAYKPTEQFSVLRDKTDVAKWSGDCEDFSKDIAMMFASLRRRNFKVIKHMGLSRLCELAAGYTCFIVDTSIYNGQQRLPPESKTDSLGTVELHMYVLLVPWAKLSKLLEEAGEEKWVSQHITAEQINATKGW